MEMEKPNIDPKTRIDPKTGQIEMPLEIKTAEEEMEEEKERISTKYRISPNLLVLQNGVWYARMPIGKLITPEEYAELRDDEKRDAEEENARLYNRYTPEKSHSKKPEFTPGPAGTTEKAVEDYLNK